MSDPPVTRPEQPLRQSGWGFGIGAAFILYGLFRWQGGSKTADVFFALGLVRLLVEIASVRRNRGGLSPWWPFGGSGR